jgi:riboflavin-specific deaminase-like protein
MPKGNMPLLPVTGFILMLCFQHYPAFIIATLPPHKKVTTILQSLNNPSNEKDNKGVTLKIAFDSQWGVTDLSSEKSERFTCAESLDMVHRLRRCSDAVLVGRSTVEADDCTLTVRRVPLGDRQQPVRVILDPSRRLNLEKFAISQDGLKTLIVHAHPSFKQTTSEEFEAVTFAGIPPGNDNKISAKDICEVLSKEHDIHHIMLEGGPNTARKFLDEGMVDRAIIVHTSVSFKAPLPSHMSPSTFEDSGLVLVGSSKSGVDRIDYYARPGEDWPSDPDPPSAWP